MPKAKTPPSAACRSAANEVIAELTVLRDEEHEFQSVVIDSADWLERLIFDEVCREYGVRTIEKADGGYGRGYSRALDYWGKITDSGGITINSSESILRWQTVN